MTVESDHCYWQSWIEAIHRWGIENWVASLIESLGPLTILAAQFIYFAKPLLNNNESGGGLEAAARLMEDVDMARLFASRLREATHQ